MSINIIRNENFGTHNTTYGRQTPKYIVMHYTASNGGTGANHISYFNNRSTTNASADFFVDEVGIYQYNMQVDTRYTWAVGDGSGGTYGNRCWNSNQISIEMCCYQSGGKWYIKDGTYENAIELAKYLMNKYSITEDRVIRHYDVSKKLCPQLVGWIPSLGEDAWNKFKGELSDSSVTKDTIYRVRKSWNDVKYQIGAYKNLESAKTLASDNIGYYVFDDKGNVVYPVTSASTNSSTSYTVKITADVLNVRQGAGILYPIVTTVKRNEVYTIVEENDGWGLLKSYKTGRNGWISLNYTVKN